MTKRIAFFCLIVITFSCKKEKRVGKEITGSWNLTSYKRTDQEGMIKYATAEGSAEFNALPDNVDSSIYKFNISYNFSGTADSLKQNGTYKLVEKGGFMYLAETNAVNQILSYIKYRILTITSTDLEIEFSKNSCTDILVFRRP